MADDSTLKQFKELFWDAWKLGRRNKTEESIAKFGELAELARANGLSAEADIAEASILQYHKELDKAEELATQVVEYPTLKLKGLALFVLGSIKSLAKDFDGAVNCFKSALDEKTFDKPCYAWHNIGFVFNKKRENDKAIDCYEKALKETYFDTQGDIWHSMGIAYSDKREYDKAIDCYKKALEDTSYDTLGNVWHNIGIAYHNKEEYDKAIDCHEKALKDTSYDTPGNAWRNMGVAYHHKEEYDKAIECYEKALEESSYDTPGLAWNSLGIAYSDKGEYDKAIDCCEKALEETSYDTPGNAWNNMGFAYSDKREYDKAIDCYKKAIDCYKKALNEPSRDMLGWAWINMGDAYESKGDTKGALRCWEKAAKAFRASGDDDRASFVEAKIAAIKVPAEQRSEKDKELLETGAKAQGSEEKPARESIEDRMVTKLAAADQDAWVEYAEREGSDVEDGLAVLKGWGSSVPLIVGGSAACRGGGYFLKWAGRGLVIDPGFDFLHNFHEQGFHAKEIDAVLVSHNHTDHNHDLKAIDDAAYELYKRENPGTDHRGYTLVCDQDTAGVQTWIDEQVGHRHECIHFDLRRREAGQEEHIKLDEIASLPFRIGYCRAKHTKQVPNAVSLRVECLNEDGDSPEIVFGFSCDTKYHKGLCDKKALGNCDILVAHISEPELSELKDKNELKEHHLGYRGVERLIKGCKPRMTIVCEFWAGHADLRIDLVQGLRKLCSTEAIFPGGVGFHLEPRTLKIRCSTCGKFVPHASISVAGPRELFGPLNYLCPHCRL